MDIFGWTITRTSKKKEDAETLHNFEKCVDYMDRVTKIGKRVVRTKPDIHTVQSLGECQEQLESLIEIYTQNKFSRPANTFSLSTLIQDMRQLYVRYVRASAALASAADELNQLNSVDVGYDEYGAPFKEAMFKSANGLYQSSTEEVYKTSKEYYISLDAIRHVISYDIMRIVTGVDIVKQYYNTKGYTIPEKGVEFTVRFKRLSRDELNAQIKSKEEDKDE